MSRSTDVLILGGGFAGLACAIRLAQAGVSVRILTLDRAVCIRLGETLAPNARQLLQSLGVWVEFTGDGHRECHANRSVWGRAEPHVYDLH